MKAGGGGAVSDVFIMKIILYCGSTLLPELIIFSHRFLLITHRWANVCSILLLFANYKTFGDIKYIFHIKYPLTVY